MTDGRTTLFEYQERGVSYLMLRRPVLITIPVGLGMIATTFVLDEPHASKAARKDRR